MTIRINTGEISEGAKVTLMLGIASPEMPKTEDFEIYVNSAPAPFDGVVRIEPEIYSGDCFCFRIEKNRFDRMFAEMYIGCAGEIQYAEVRVTP